VSGVGFEQSLLHPKADTAQTHVRTILP